ncbi:MAG: GNAT family N-acetyltransferase [Bacteroidales bacterium]|nr:GNAT family N-acetyltransferase [Bacteroidales bacterium]
MMIEITTLDRIQEFRTDYLNSLPEFQELYIELMISTSGYYIFQADNKETGYAIRNKDGVLIEFYVMDKYIPESNMFFRQVLKDLSIKGIYCKSFDSLLISNCLLNTLPYSILGLLFRDYVEPWIKKDPDIEMKRADLSSVGFMLRQDDSIKELFETEEQLIDFIKNENVFEFYKNEELVGCGMVIRTHPDWRFCDLGVWVKPSKRGNAIGSQIILNLKDFSIKNNLKPSCGCAIENKASQRTIEKSGFVSKYELIHFITQ